MRNTRVSMRPIGWLALAISASLQAQPADDETDAAATALQTIEVTGSHLRDVDLETRHPTFVIDRAAIMRSGLTGVGDILQTLVTANGVSENRNINNGNNGEQRINLRSLGSNRTLVLVNGQRWVSTLDGAVDLSTIPLAVVERIEIVTDGVSAIYGSDAIAGVVNIITRKNYNGGEFGGYFGGNEHGDGRRRAADLSFGRSAENWHAAIGIAYGKEDPIFAGERAISAVPRYGLPIDATGSFYTAYGRFYIPEFGRSFVLVPGRPGTSSDDFAYFDPARDYSYNYAPLNFLQTPQDQRSVFAQGRHALSQTLAASFDLLVTQRRSAQRFAEPPISWNAFLQGPAAFEVSPDNLFNPFGSEYGLGIPIGFRRFTEQAPRRTEQTMDTTRVHLGLEGMLTLAGREFIWGFDFNDTRSKLDEESGSFANNERLALALGPSFLDETGIARCGTAGAVISGCVPLNLFGGPGSITPEMFDYITIDSLHNSARGESREVNLHASGDLLELPAGMLAIAVGVVRREDSAEDHPDELTSRDLVNGTGYALDPTEGHLSVNEAYVELNVPLLKEHALARTLDLGVASRYSDYSGFGATHNAQFGLRWKPVDDVLVRANYAQGFRAPSVRDLFGGAFRSSGDESIAFDLCAARGGYAPNPTVAANCLAQGVPEDVSQSFLTNIIEGSNRELRPEIARTRTLGIVYNPSWMPGLEAGLDWYRIQLRDAIGQRGAQAVIDDCHQFGDLADCARIVRNADGSLFSVNAITENLQGGLETEGYDFALAWRRATSLGEIELRWDNTYTSYFGEVGQPERGTIGADGAYLYGNGVGQEQLWRLRSVFGVTWQRNAWQASISARHFSSIIEDCGYVTYIAGVVGDESLRELCSDPDFELDGEPSPRNRVGSVTYFDLDMAWQSPWNGRFTLGARNAFDRDPPVSYTSVNSFFSSYDVPGRYWYMSYRQMF